ncbi:MAG: hypothetical protein AB7E76_11370 [Deferribacterales bacterium]|jgi:hypothetical protein
MIKYLTGTVIVFILAYIIVTYSVKQAGADKSFDEAMDVPFGEYTAMGIREAANEEDGYLLYLDNLNLYESRDKKGTTCNTNLEIYFPLKKNAKLVMKLRYNVGVFLAKPLREMTAQEALMPEGQYTMIKSLKDGYAERYKITNMTKVILKDFTCKEVD